MLKVNLERSDPELHFHAPEEGHQDGARYFGPFVSSTRVAQCRRAYTKTIWFNLRGCRVFTPGAPDYKHCLYAHLKYCTAPCVGNVTREQYLEQVVAARNFLEGQCQRDGRASLSEEDEDKPPPRTNSRRPPTCATLSATWNDTWKRTEKFARVPYTLPLSNQS